MSGPLVFHSAWKVVTPLNYSVDSEYLGVEPTRIVPAPHYPRAALSPVLSLYKVTYPGQDLHVTRNGE